MTWSCAGIDGCRAGWFIVYLNPHGLWGIELVSELNQLTETLSQLPIALIDIPIGLVDHGPVERDCDLDARRLLGKPRSSSVFTPPARITLQSNSYEMALEINRQLTGRGLSIQCWNILSKIREADNLLKNHENLQGIMRESHPEVCFSMLNGGRAMSSSKKQQQGREERLAVLRRFFPAADSLLAQASSQHRRGQLALDDVIDAMVLAVTAQHGHGVFKTLPGSPVIDSQGYPMEIVYVVS